MHGKRAPCERVGYHRNAGPSVVAVAVIAMVVAIPSLGSDSSTDKPSVSAVSDAPRHLRVGAWNILKLGHGYRKDISAVARAIEAHFDVVALVEVMQKEGTHPGYDELRRVLGSHWIGLVTKDPRPNTNAGSAEYYAILFRKNRVAVCEGWKGIVYHEDNDGTQGEDEPDLFEREPAFACLQSNRNGAKTAFDFMFAAYHARWTGGAAKRMEEVKNLEGVFRAMCEARPGETDLIIAGDFNLTPSQMETALGNRPKISGSGSTLNSSGVRTENIYDYLLIGNPDATSEITEQPAIIDVRWVSVDHETFRKTVSDHLAVVAVFRTSGQDDDASGGSARSECDGDER